jgi:hypothetical protein
MTALLKYHILLLRVPLIVEVLKLKECLLLEKHRSNILKIFQDILPFDLFEQVYSMLHREFQKFIDHATLEEYFKSHTSTFSKRPFLGNADGTNFEARLN